MKSSARPLILVVLAYYAVMILVYLGREVEGSGLGKAVRLSAVAYVFGMLLFYLEREVLSDVQVIASDAEPESNGQQEQQRSSTAR